VEYRQAYSNEFTKIAAFLKRKGYTVMDPARMGGYWIVAIQDDYVHGCIWFFGERPNAYVDYLASDYPRVAAMLCEFATRVLVANRITYVRGVVRSDNANAIRFMTEGVGMLSHAGYDLLFKELSNGIPRRVTERNHDHNDTGGERPGKGASTVVVPNSNRS
jgi:hypothetical protein